MTIHITMEKIARPPCPTLPLSAAQLAFLRFHCAPNPPHMWRWHFLGTQLRATAEAGSVTISSRELNALVSAGLMRRGAGCADVAVTALGRSIASHGSVNGA
jgi:hypothetical protein